MPVEPGRHAVVDEQLVNGRRPARALRIERPRTVRVAAAPLEEPRERGAAAGVGAVSAEQVVREDELEARAARGQRPGEPLVLRRAQRPAPSVGAWFVRRVGERVEDDDERVPPLERVVVLAKADPRRLVGAAGVEAIRLGIREHRLPRGKRPVDRRALARLTEPAHLAVVVAEHHEERNRVARLLERRPHERVALGHRGLGDRGRIRAQRRPVDGALLDH